MGEGPQMMKQAFILHGVCDEDEYLREDFPSPSNAHWLPWLQQKFLRAGYLAQCLEMPTPYKPEYAAWCEVWERWSLSENTTLVGHSAGGGFLMKWLSMRPDISLGKVVLVAPWLDPRRECGDFLKTKLDSELLGRIGELHILVSSDEPVEGVPETVELLQKTYPKAVIHRFGGLRHFYLSDTGLEFPPLWDICQ